MQKIKSAGKEKTGSTPNKKRKVETTDNEAVDKKKVKKPEKALIPKKDFKKPISSKNPKKNKENNNLKTGPDGKPLWAEMKKSQKELRLTRRKAKATDGVFEMSHKAKLLAAQIQRKLIKPDLKLNLCKELHLLLKKNYKSIALTHDLSRVIQVLLKYGSEDIRNEVTDEVLDIMPQMVQSKYAQHSVKRILKHGTDGMRQQVINKFLGNIVSLAAHSISAPILDFAYVEFATTKQKHHMQQEFYGDLYKKTKDDRVKTLSDAYKLSPGMKAGILQACKANIQRVLDKNLHDSELLHSVLYDYISECNADDRAELISSLSPLVVPLTNSLPGVNTACVCVWQGSNKDKKTILKVVKEHIIPMSKHKTGYRLLLAIFDSVDDTVLVKKTIVSTLASNIKDVAKDHWGIMTLHWLVKPRDKLTFHPKFNNFLEEGAKHGTSKKNTEIRTKELREAIIPAIKEHIVNEAEFWLSSKPTLLLLVAVLSVESSKEIMQALAKVTCNSAWNISVKNQETPAIEDAGVHMVLKKIAAMDNERTDGTFGEAVSEHLTDETIQLWIQSNRGCFFLLKLIESNTKPVAELLKKKLTPHASILKKQTSTGAKHLVSCLQN